jgi:drug/metabolite transporter (DMT)-like permease
MFYLVALVSMLAYALQGVLMTSVYRSIDTLSAAAYRGLALAITMLPLLYLVPLEEYGLLSEVKAELFVASLAAIIGNWAMATAYRHLPVGIAQALIMSISVTILAAWGYISLGDQLTNSEIVFGIIILSLVGRLTVIRAKDTHAENPRVLHGLAAGFCAGFVLGTAFALIALISRVASPFLIAYAWETLIGFLGVGLLIVRFALGRIPAARITPRYFGYIMACSSPTLIGTAGYAYAVSMGPAAVVGAISSCNTVVISLLGMALYKDKISRREWIFIGLIVLAVALLRLLGTR